MISAHAETARKTFPAAVVAVLLGAGLLVASPPASFAQTAAAPEVEQPKGLWLTTPYPVFTARLGEKIDIDLKLANNGMPPQRVELDVSGLPKDWKWKIEGDGREIGGAIAASNDKVDLTLEVTPPEGAETKTYDFEITGKTGSETLRLPVRLTLAKTEPGKLTMEPELPALRGTVRSNFDFQVTLENEGPKDEVVNLLSKAPSGFQVTFKERYGSQELTSLPLDAGASKDITVSVEPPRGIEAGQYPVTVAATGGDLSAQTQLLLDITGQANLVLSGPGGRLSGNATAGQERTFNLQLENTGTAPAREISFSASPPSGWKVTFNPEEIAEVPAGETKEVSVAMTPSDKAIAGDYMVTVRANGDGVSDSADMRVTVETSTVWGVAGLGVIAAAVVVLGFAVSRYGRR